MVIKILGSGCPKCKQLAANAAQAVEESGVACSIEKVEDLGSIMNYGVMLTPALVVDEVVKSTGKVLSKEQIMEYLK